MWQAILVLIAFKFRKIRLDLRFSHSGQGCNPTLRRQNLVRDPDRNSGSVCLRPAWAT